MVVCEVHLVLSSAGGLVPYGWNVSRGTGVRRERFKEKIRGEGSDFKLYKEHSLLGPVKGLATENLISVKGK